MRKALLSLLACPLIMAGFAQAQVAQARVAPIQVFQVQAATAVPSAAAPVPWARAEVLALAEKAADYQIKALAQGIKPSPVMKTMPAADGWEQGAFFVGLAALADRSPNPEWGEALQQRGKDNAYAFGARTYDADDQTIGTAYFWDYRHGGGDAAIAAMRARMDTILAHPPTNALTFEGDGHTCRDRWCWADALFMGPQVWLEMSRVTGDARYATYAKSEFFATLAELYDPQEHLFYRDSRFFERRDIDGAKLFWSRGDGWVFAGIARMLDLIPADDPDRPRIEAVFKEMAVKLKTLQKPDGFWSPSLLGDPDTALPEESGTAFYTYGMAWGVKTGLLDRATYEPVVRSGWAALNRALHPDGRVGYVQPVSDRPDAVDYDNTQFYGVGGFLLAAGAVADLDLPPVEPLKAVLDVKNPSAYDQPAAALSLGTRTIGADDKAAAGGWSVVMDGRVYAAQWTPIRGDQPAALSFVLPLKAHARTTVRIVPQAAPLPLRVQAILNIQDGGARDPADKVVKGGVFHLHRTWLVPAAHTAGDRLVAFDGIGLESDKIAYRVTLDGRDTVGVLAKTSAETVLQDMGQSSDAVATDLFTVGEVRHGTFERLCPAALVATAADDGPVAAEASVTRNCLDGRTAGQAMDYTIGIGSPLTFVHVSVRDTSAIAAGIARHDDAQILRPAKSGGWSYIATYGPQGRTGGNLGAVLFFRPTEVSSPRGDDSHTLYVTFRDAAPVLYAFAATTPGDGTGVRSLDDFKAWLEATRDGLDHPATIVLRVP